jgi:hypothetical protein
VSVIKHHKVWEAKAADGTLLGYFTVEAAAEDAVESKKMHMPDGDVVERHVITIGDELGARSYLLADREPIHLNDAWERREAARKRALEKLTPEEREALGV